MNQWCVHPLTTFQMKAILSLLIPSLLTVTMNNKPEPRRRVRTKFSTVPSTVQVSSIRFHHVDFEYDAPYKSVFTDLNPVMDVGATDIPFMPRFQ